MTKEELCDRLYNHYYSEAMASGRGDIDASVYAYDQASNDLTSLNRQELKAYMRRLGILP